MNSDTDVALPAITDSPVTKTVIEVNPKTIPIPSQGTPDVAIYVVSGALVLSIIMQTYVFLKLKKLKK